MSVSGAALTMFWRSVRFGRLRSIAEVSTRRIMWRSGVATIVATAAALAVPHIEGQSCEAALNAIVCENQLPGNPAGEWDISGSGDGTLQGFATEISVNKGSTVRFKVNTTAASFNIAIYRLGYYGGLGARKIDDPHGTRRQEPGELL